MNQEKEEADWVKIQAWADPELKEKWDRWVELHGGGNASWSVRRALYTWMVMDKECRENLNDFFGRHGLAALDEGAEWHPDQAASQALQPDDRQRGLGTSPG